MKCTDAENSTKTSVVSKHNNLVRPEITHVHKPILIYNYSIWELHRLSATGQTKSCYIFTTRFEYMHTITSLSDKKMTTTIKTHTPRIREFD